MPTTIRCGASRDANVFRVGHPLAQRLIDLARTADTPSSELVFQYTGSGKNIAVLQPLVGSSGWLACARMTITDLLTTSTRSSDMSIR
jgi:hypothetical protein